MQHSPNAAALSTGTAFEWKMWFSCFPVLPGSAEAQVIWGGILKYILIAYFIGNISANKHQNSCVSELGGAFFFETRCIMVASCVNWFGSVTPFQTSIITS